MKILESKRKGGREKEKRKRTKCTNAKQQSGTENGYSDRSVWSFATNQIKYLTRANKNKYNFSFAWVLIESSDTRTCYINFHWKKDSKKLTTIVSDSS